MKTISPELKAHLEQEVTTLAVLWKIVRLDGAIYCFTDHVEDVTYLGDVYKAASGFLRSAIGNNSSTDGADMEAAGILDDDGIVERDLVSGKFDYAEAWLKLVNYEDLTMGHLSLRSGRFGEVQMHPSGKFVIEFRGLVGLLKNAIGDTYSPDCSTDLFSPKCKLRSSALGRLAGRHYDAGARVTVPTSETPGAYALPFANLDFQDVHYGDSTAWAVSNMVARLPPGEASRVLSPTTWIASVYQTLVVSPLNSDGTVLLPLVAEITSRSMGQDLQMRLRLTYFDENQDEISSNTTVYTTLVDLETRTLEATAPLGTWFVTFYVETRQRPGSDGNFASNADTRFYDPVLRLASDSLNRIVDPALLTFSLGTATVAGWSGTGLVPYQMRNGIAGPNGKYFVMKNVAWGIARSGPVSLTGGPISDTEIDTGDYVLDLSWWQANIDLNGSADMQVTFFGPALPVSGIASGWDYQEIVPTGSWKNRKKTIPVPVGARTVTIHMQMERSRLTDFESQSMSAIGDISTTLRSVFDIGYNFASYGGVEYEALTSGITASTPAFDWSRTLADTVVDGTVTWQVVVPRWSNLATLASVTSRGIFTLDASVVRDDDFFQWGMVVFLTGPNAGFSSDIAKFVASTRRIELALPLPFVPDTGDQVWVEVGCDKTVATCQAKFGNAINFRGFPNLPGTDQYFKIGSPA